MWLSWPGAEIRHPPSHPAGQRQRWIAPGMVWPPAMLFPVLREAPFRSDRRVGTWGRVDKANPTNPATVCKVCSRPPAASFCPQSHLDSTLGFVGPGDPGPAHLSCWLPEPQPSLSHARVLSSQLCSCAYKTHVLPSLCTNPHASESSLNATSSRKPTLIAPTGRGRGVGRHSLNVFSVPDMCWKITITL